jgi:hypothetical protein
MEMKRLLTCCSSTFAVAMLAPCISARSQDIPNGISKVNRTAIVAADVDFQRVTMSRIEELEQDPNTGIALRASWERVRRTASLHDVPRPQPVGRNEMERFLRLVDARLKVPVPTWWSEMTLTAQAYSRDNIFFLSPKDAPYYQSDSGILVPKDLTVVRSASGVLIAAPSKYQITPKVFDEISHGTSPIALSALVGETRAFVAIHTTRGFSYRLFAIDRTNASVLWSSQVKAHTVPFGVYSGFGFHFVALVEKGELLYVFGAADDSVYVEAFSTDNGTNVFRFCTSI